jgi:diaminohydroxyphosphoribosylaminopyrimidine deaminase/5-amino-6-(5-phosphoribosylamino)uracil reductase
MELNKRYFTFHHEKRPYIILKWAQTADGFIDRIRTKDEKPEKITGNEADRLVHEWRSEEQAIMVGTNTVIMDNPQLTTRLVEGKSPIRITIDRKNTIPPDAKIFSNFVGVIVLKEGEIKAIGKELYKRNIQSVIIEGGRKLLTSFIESGMWDEARVFYSEKRIGKGIEAPRINLIPVNEVKVGKDILREYNNT